MPNHLYVADSVNSRVLGWASAAAFTNDQPADIVIGQPDALSVNCNDGIALGDSNGIGADSLCDPIDVAVDSRGNLYVADAGNNRVLEYPTPFANSSPIFGQSAIQVWGQTDSFTATGCNFGSATINGLSLCSPEGVTVDSSGDLYVSDTDNNRVLEFNPGDTVADDVFGQSGIYTTGVCNGGDAPSADTLCTPRGLVTDASGDLFVADMDNSRVLEFNQPLAPLNPLTGAGDTTADLVFGQGGSGTSFTTQTCASSTAVGICDPVGVSLDPLGNLIVADQFNNRVLEYNQPLASSNVTADEVFGQGSDPLDFAGNVCANSAPGNPAPSAAGMCQPAGVAMDALGNLYVADETNNRVLRFDAPIVPGATPTPSVTATPTASDTPTATPSDTAVPTDTPTDTAVATATATATASATDTATASATATATDTMTASATSTATATATSTDTATPTATATDTPTATSTATDTATATPTDTLTPTATPTDTVTATATDTATASATATQTATATDTVTATATDTITPTPTATETATATATDTATASATATQTATATDTVTATATDTNTATATATQTATATATDTATASATATQTATATDTVTATATDTNTATATATQTATATATDTPTATATATITATASATNTATATSTSTPTATSTATATPTGTATATPTSSLTATATPSASATSTGTPTATATGTATSTATNTATATGTPTATATGTATSTATNTATATATGTATASSTQTGTATATSTSTATATATPSPVRTPVASATATATSTATATATSTPTATPTATAVPVALKISPHKLNLGKVVYGHGASSRSKKVTIQNKSKTTPVTFSSIATSGDFAMVSECGATLGVKSKCSVSVTFKPTALGASSGTLTIRSNADNSPSSVGLSGIGIQPKK